MKTAENREPLSFIPRGQASRSRSLAIFERYFSRRALRRALLELIAARGSERLRVLEIGCGEGRVLMELRKLFPSLVLHGINKRPWTAMRGRESFRHTARHYRIFTAHQLRRVRLPYIRFYDAQRLRFPDASFDLVYSQVAIHYVKRKDLLLQEVWRVLRPGGRALLNLDDRRPNMPDFLDADAPRFRIYQGRRLLALKQLFAERRRAGLDLKYHRRGHRLNLEMRKNTCRPLRLGLRFDRHASFDLTPFDRLPDEPLMWGYRSVFHLRPRRSKK